MGSGRHYGVPSDQRYCVAEWCNGSTCDSVSYCLGSNPSSAAKEHEDAPFSFTRKRSVFCFIGKKLYWQMLMLNKSFDCGYIQCHTVSFANRMLALRYDQQRFKEKETLLNLFTTFEILRLYRKQRV